MNTEMHIKTKIYWDNLSKDDRLKLLEEYNFWSGLSDYLYDYIAEDLKRLLSLKIDLNDEINENSTIIS
jgi:hypothetical protein